MTNDEMNGRRCVFGDHDKAVFVHENLDVDKGVVPCLHGRIACVFCGKGFGELQMFGILFKGVGKICLTKQAGK